MENIQRDLAKEIAALQSPKPARKNKRWTLLFVGDHGEVVTIRWFRWIVMVWVFFLVLAAIISGILYYLYRQTRNENVNLERSLDTIQQQIVGLRSDKEVLMARLVVAETDMERLLARQGPKQVEKAPGDRPEDRAKKEPRSNIQGAQKREAAGLGQEGKLLAGTPPADAVAQKKELKVSVEEFNVFHDEASSTFRAQFILRNAGQDSNMVSGYTAVILKKPDTQPDNWLTLPTLKLDAGVPAGDKKGQYFSIARFKTVRFMVKSKMDPRQFNTATVYVFDENKDLLLEKNFSINIQETVFTPNQ
ncbi:MAG: hypothetical protein P1P89_07825 [Desulfobacterales bacterium]|nr:hypothetical protein [Desulfobacterales bacterium]